MNALGASILSILVVTVLLASKRWALMGTIAGILYLTQAQRVNIVGFNLYAVRFIELAAFIRVLIRKEISFSKLNTIDRTLVLLYVYTVSVFLLRSSEDQAYQIGMAVDALLSYFAFRGLVTDAEDFKWLLRASIILLAPYVVLVSIETITFNNPFSAMGAYANSQWGDAWFRGGRLRATGSFGHPSLMGTLGGTYLPLYMSLWLAKFGRNDRRFALIGICLSLALVWASNSGGPTTCVAAALLGWMLWPIRRDMRLVRRGLVCILVLLAVVMKAPIWYLLAKISSVSGGDGFHRAVLLDMAFQNLDKWWLAGMRVLDTANWLPYTNSTTGAVDMTNHFLVFGIFAGLGSLILMVALLIQGFRYIGRALVVIRSNKSTEKSLEYLCWGLGVVLWVHLINWFGITYWDQINLVWFMHLASISSLTEKIIRPESEDITVPLVIC